MKSRLILSAGQTGCVELTPETEFERSMLAIFGDNVKITSYTEMKNQGPYDRTEPQLERAIIRFMPIEEKAS